MSDNQCPTSPANDASLSSESDSPLSHGADCDCEDCTFDYLATCTAKDEAWCREHHLTGNPDNYDFNLSNAELVMLGDDGLYLPTEFDPEEHRVPNETIEARSLFPPRILRIPAFPNFVSNRFIMTRHRNLRASWDLSMMLIYIDGYCRHEGSDTARAGYGFCYTWGGKDERRPGRAIGGFMPGRVETFGPDGVRGKQTVRRAELRAVIAALEWRYWYRESWEAIVIATSTTFVMEMINEHLSPWVKQDWFMDDGRVVPDRDLWKRLLWLFRLYAIHGCEIEIWCIPMEQNQAYPAATVGAEMPEKEHWQSLKDPSLARDAYFNF